jgi:hypothetical protein
MCAEIGDRARPVPGWDHELGLVYRRGEGGRYRDSSARPSSEPTTMRQGAGWKIGVAIVGRQMTTCWAASQPLPFGLLVGSALAAEIGLGRPSKK